MDNLSTLSSCATPLEISISSVVVNDVDYNLSSETVNGPFTESSSNVLAELDSCNDFVDVSYLSSSQFLSSKDPELCNDSMDLLMEKSPRKDSKFPYQDPLLNQGNIAEVAETTMKSVGRPTECDSLKDDYIDFSLLSMIGYGLDCNDTLEPIQDKNSDFSEKFSLENKSRPFIIRSSRTKTIYESNMDKNMNISKEKHLKTKKVLTEEVKPVIIKNISNQCILNTSMLNKLKRVASGEAFRLIADINTETESAKLIVKINIKTAKGGEVLFKNEKTSDSKYIMGSYLVNRVMCANNLEHKGKCSKAQQSEFDDDFINEVLKKYSITDDILYCIITTSGLHMWLCPYVDCGRALYKLHALKRHLVIHFGVKPFKCDAPDCKWSFYTSFRLKRHQETHLKIKMFKCSEENCDRTFTTIYNLRCHKKIHERPANIKCLVPSCNTYFQTLKARETHLKTHQKEEAPYKCKFNGCEKGYFSLNSLTAHSRAHSHKESELKCAWPNCGRMFDQPCRLREHMRQHTGDKPYVCDYKDCTWAFPSASKLRRHQNTHKKERPYPCIIGNCTKAFFRSEHLKEHTLTHLTQRTFQCEICQAKFSSKSSIYMHHKKAHPGLCQQTTLTSCLKDEHLHKKIIQTASSEYQEDTLSMENISAILMNENEVLIRIPDIVDLSTFHLNTTDVVAASTQKNSFLKISPCIISPKEQNSDIILQQAIQSLGVPSDIMLTGNQDNILTGLLLTEETEFDDRSNLTQLLDVSDNNFSESTINLRDLD